MRHGGPKNLLRMLFSLQAQSIFVIKTATCKFKQEFLHDARRNAGHIRYGYTFFHANDHDDLKNRLNFH
jgi:hypothetical protein